MWSSKFAFYYWYLTFKQILEAIIAAYLLFTYAIVKVQQWYMAEE